MYYERSPDLQCTMWSSLLLGRSANDPPNIGDLNRILCIVLAYRDLKQGLAHRANSFVSAKHSTELGAGRTDVNFVKFQFCHYRMGSRAASTLRFRLLGRLWRHRGLTPRQRLALRQIDAQGLGEPLVAGLGGLRFVVGCVGHGNLRPIDGIWQPHHSRLELILAIGLR